jgi:hypothetical protein
VKGSVPVLLARGPDLPVDTQDYVRKKRAATIAMVHRIDSAGALRDASRAGRCDRHAASDIRSVVRRILRPLEVHRADSALVHRVAFELRSSCRSAPLSRQQRLRRKPAKFLTSSCLPLICSARSAGYEALDPMLKLHQLGFSNGRLHRRAPPSASKVLRAREASRSAKGASARAGEIRVASVTPKRPHPPLVHAIEFTTSLTESVTDPRRFTP